MDDELIHIRVGKKIKKEMQALIDKGMFTNQSEIAREGIRDLLIKYNSYIDSTERNKKQDCKQDKNSDKKIIKK